MATFVYQVVALAFLFGVLWLLRIFSVSWALRQFGKRLGNDPWERVAIVVRERIGGAFWQLAQILQLIEHSGGSVLVRGGAEIRSPEDKLISSMNVTEGDAKHINELAKHICSVRSLFVVWVRIEVVAARKNQAMVRRLRGAGRELARLRRANVLLGAPSMVHFRIRLRIKEVS